MVISIAGNIYEGGSIQKGRFKGVRKSATHLSGVARMDDMETGCMEEEDGDTIASYSIENFIKEVWGKGICRDDGIVNDEIGYWVINGDSLIVGK